MSVRASPTHVRGDSDFEGESPPTPIPELPPSPGGVLGCCPNLDGDTEWEGDVDEIPVVRAPRATCGCGAISSLTTEKDNVDEIPIVVVSPTAARLRRQQERQQKWDEMPQPRHPRDNPSNSGVASDSGSFRWGDQSSAGSDEAKLEEQLAYNRRCKCDSALRAIRWKRIEESIEAAVVGWKSFDEAKSAERRRVKRLRATRSNPELVEGWSWVPGPGVRAYPGSETDSYTSDAA